MFVSTVHSQVTLSDIQKFQYLKGLLSEEPASLIKHIPLSNESYQEAWEKLLDRYDKKKQIIHSLIKLFLDQKSIVNPNSLNIRNLLNTSDEVIRGLKAVGDEATNRDPWLIYLLFQKLDPETRRLWSIESTETEFPSLKEFFDFLSVRCSSLELISQNENDMKHSKSSNFVGSRTTSNYKQLKACLKCHGMHPLYKCMKFKSMDVIARKNFIRRNNCCFLCLNFHKVKECPNSHLKCFKCESKHNTLLHEENKGNACTVNFENKVFPHSSEDKNLQSNVSESLSHKLQINSSASFNNSKCVSFLPTARVLLYNTENKAYSFRALLDSGSECSFVSENVVRTLGLRRKNDRLVLNGIAGVSAGQTHGSVTLTIGSKLSNESLNVHAYMPKVTSQLPAELLDVKNMEYIKNVTLADEDFMKPQECDVILGSDCFFTILRHGRIVSSENEPIAQNTMFGWVVAGKMEPKCKYSSTIKSHFLSVENESNIDMLLQRFWQAEEINVKKSHLSEEEEFCENHFRSTYQITPEGRFEVKLPKFNDIMSLGDSKAMAVSRLFAMEKKFQFDKPFESEYRNFMTQYEELGHMTPVDENSNFTNNKVYYLPHHSVIKSDSVSTKLRVVFDGSCKPFQC